MSKIDDLKASLRSSVRGIAIFSVVTNVLLLAAPVHMMQVYDRVLASGSRSTLFYITLITLIAIGIYAVSEIIRGRLAQRMSARFVTEVAEDVFRSVVAGRLKSDDEAKVMRELQTIRMFLAGRQFVGLFDLPFAPLFLAVLFLLHFSLGIAASVGIAALTGIAVLNKRMTESASKQSSSANSEATGFSNAVLRRAEDIRAMGLLPSIMERWGAKTALSLNKADESSVYASVFYGLSRFVRQSLQVLVMAWGAFLVLDGQMSGGMIFAASMVLGRCLQPIEQLIGAWESVNRARESWTSISQLIEEAGGHKEPMELPSPLGLITAEQIHFSAGGDMDEKQILSGVSFQLEPGQIMAVVGPSGAGKSTLARILAGATPPTSGVVQLDGSDLEHWSDHQRGRHIGYVPQDIVLFPGTIAENIARLEVDPDDGAIVRAAQMAGIHEMVAGLADGYATQIGPAALTLSGGQRQRVALARAFFTQPKVLVLDEPNAHLDAAGEKSLMQCLVRAKQNGTGVFVVSQRRSLLQIADRVMTIEDGKITSLLNRKSAAPGKLQSAKQEKIGIQPQPQPQPQPERDPLAQSLDEIADKLRGAGPAPMKESA